MYIFLKRQVIFFLVTFLCFCLSASAQQVVFTVTGVKGFAKIGDSKLKVGLKIRNDQILKVEPNTYLSLATTDNRVLEVTKEGSYSVRDLLAKVPSRQDLNTSYVAFVVSELTKGSEEQVAAKNRFQHMNKTGAVKRSYTNKPTTKAEKDYKFGFLLEYIETKEGHTLFGNILELDWKVEQPKGADTITNYEVEILSRDETSLFSQTVNGTELSIDLSFLDLAGKEDIICRVIPLNKAGEFWSKQKDSFDIAIKLLDEKTKNEIASKLIPSRSAMEKLVEAKFFEDKELFLDAMHAYKEAMRLDTNPLYEELYYRFLLRNSKK